jgi:hypothetical protein
MALQPRVGTVLNPMLCEGQIHGGVVQDVFQVLMENIAYDPDSGQLLSGSFQDCCMPRADNFWDFTLGSNHSHTDRNPLGVKGVGEAPRRFRGAGRSGSHLTRRWREMDSNPRSPVSAPLSRGGREGPRVCGLAGGGRWIRTLGPPLGKHFFETTPEPGN